MPRQRVLEGLLRRLLVCARGGPSSGSSPTPLLYAGPVNCLLSSLVTSCTRYEGWEYGPDQATKMRLDLQFVKSFCFCFADPFFVSLLMASLFGRNFTRSSFGGFSATKWTAGLRALNELGVPNALDCHGHDIRRGAAIRYFLSAECGGHAPALQLASRLTKSRQASLRRTLQMSQGLIHNTFFSFPHWHWIYPTTLPMHPCLERKND